MILRPQPLTREAFLPFGEVIQTAGQTPRLINRGQTEKFADLAKLRTEGGGRTGVHIYRSQPVSIPVVVYALECHPLGSQAFIPLHDRPFPLLVAPIARQPDMNGLRLFLTDGTQGFNLKPGVWHHYQMSLGEVSDYLVIDRVGEGTNLEEFELPVPIRLEL